MEWISEIPECCDLCQSKIDDMFADGKTLDGPWAIMCPFCALTKGVGLGEGCGQLYSRVGDKFVKVKG